MDKKTHPYFVPDDTQGNRRDTATLLVGTATEGDGDGPIPQREVAATQGGFRISERVYKALGWDEDDEDDSVSGQTETRMPTAKTVTPTESPLDSEPDVPTEDEADEDAEEDAEEEDAEEETLDYSEWDRADLLAEITRRGIDTEDKKTVTLVAALNADDKILDEDDTDSDGTETTES